MNPNTKLFRVLKFLYLNRDRKLTSREIAENTGVQQKNVASYIKDLIRRMNIEKINGLNHYQMKPNQVEYVGNILKRSEEQKQYENESN